MNKHRIVVALENNPYAAWQAKLIYFSCVTRLQHSPLIVVHASGDDELHRDYQTIMALGGAVHRAPNYRFGKNGEDYFPRNTAGTLLHAAELCGTADEFIVLCDPDMIFVRQPDFPSTLAGELYGYMDYDRPIIDVAAEQFGITRTMIDAQKAELRCGVPYVIPINAAAELAHLWLKAIDAFPPRRWEDQMYAFGFAIIRLGLRMSMTRLVNHNYWPDRPLTRPIVHFCYANIWNKRDYFTEEEAPRVWEPSVTAEPGSILEAVLFQITEAKEFYAKLAS